LQLLTDAEKARLAVVELDKIKSEFTAFLCHGTSFAHHIV
jgi:hypothetical protein